MSEKPLLERLQQEQAWLITWSLVVLAGVAVAACLVVTQSVMIPFVLSVFLALLVSPVVDFVVVTCRLPKMVGVLTAMVVVLAIMVIAGLMLLAGYQAIQEATREYSVSTANLSEKLFSTLSDLGVTVDETEIRGEVRSRLPDFVTQAVGTFSNLTSSGLLIFIFVVFLLAGRNSQAAVTGIYAEIDAKVRRYLATKIAISAVTGALVWMILSLLGLKLAYVFGILTFFFNFIPSLGSIVATLLPIPVALAQFDSRWQVLWVVLLPGAVQTTFGNIVEPKLMGQGLKLHPVTILLSLAVWGVLWGIMGMVLAVPMVASLRIVLMQIETTRPLGNLLAGQLPDSTGVVEE